MTNTYYIYFKQVGEGCDYTIGCGNHLIKITSEEENILSVVNEHIKENYPVNSEYELCNALIFKNPIEVNIKELYKEQIEEMEEETLKRKEKKELEEYLRLKKKFG